MANQPPPPPPRPAPGVHSPAPTPPMEPRPLVVRPRIRPLIPAIAAIVPVATTGSIPSSPTPRASASFELSIVRLSSSVQSSPSAKSFGLSSSNETSLTPKTTPSPLSSQTKFEQKIPKEVQEKTVVLQKSIGEEEVSNENEINEKGKSSGKTILDSMEAGTLISIAAENKVVDKNKNLETKSHVSGSKSGTDSDKEGNLKKNKSHKEKGINSSILYNCSYTHHHPGKHLDLFRN
ncbi:hypothetical protein CIPAW_02G042900 [Carya illinoinensis]|uniref:Uncharacterized protein n=1 Tax=Carya illinoinensis TaxID=32201 RepID=A0A8T1RA20_CARIL|nr:hypothetical protein CIPAW_02G042900 [Carya illinoinensis]